MGTSWSEGGGRRGGVSIVAESLPALVLAALAAALLLAAGTAPAAQRPATPAPGEARVTQAPRPTDAHLVPAEAHLPARRR